MGRCPTRKVKKRRLSHKTARRDKFEVKGDDLVYTELRKPDTEIKPFQLDEDLCNDRVRKSLRKKVRKDQGNPNVKYLGGFGLNGRAKSAQNVDYVIFRQGSTVTRVGRCSDKAVGTVGAD